VRARVSWRAAQEVPWGSASVSAAPRSGNLALIRDFGNAGLASRALAKAMSCE